MYDDWYYLDDPRDDADVAPELDSDAVLLHDAHVVAYGYELLNQEDVWI